MKNNIQKHHNKINKFLEGYFKEKHTPKDLKMIKGAFTSRKLRNNELERFNLSQGASKDEEISHVQPPYRPGSDEEDSMGLHKLTLKS